MDYRKIIDKLEHDLAHYLINELTKDDPSKRQSYEMYKYKGLTISANPRSKAQDKTVAVRIGSLEAEFKLGTGDKCNGSLAPAEERLVSIFFARSENASLARKIFDEADAVREVAIVPFELDDIFTQSTED